ALHVEDLPSRAIRGRRAFLERTPSAARMLLGMPFVGQLFGNWIVDAEIRVIERDGRVLVGVQLRTTLPQQIGNGLTEKEFEGIMADLQRLQPAIAAAEAVAHDPIVPPGDVVPEVFTATLRDYSSCAVLEELGSLRQCELAL